MDKYNEDKTTALQAKGLAQQIAFAPVIFQVTRTMRDTGILAAIDDAGEVGITLAGLMAETGLSRYGLRVLLESSLGIGLVLLHGDSYRITKTGHFILHDRLTNVNMNFVHDVCYKGLFWLEESIREGTPAGLKELGPWETVYEGLSQLPPHIQKSWFEFDHFFSDIAFPLVLPHVYGNGVTKLLEIGGNTGKWAIASTRYTDDVHITVMDLPGQLKLAQQQIQQLGLNDRVSFIPANILDQAQPLPTGFDAVWMSQFLDCFSEEEIVSILQRCADAIHDDGCILILEAFWDRQRFETAAFCLQQTSIYFTAIANGNSQMYDSRVFIHCIEEAGFEVAELIDGIGLSHTLLKCRKKISRP